MSLNRRSTRSRVRAAAPPSFPCLVSALLAFSLSFAATLQPAHAQAAAPVFDAARARLQDAETIRSLTDEGRELMQKDRIKLDGFQYCGQSVALAERGEFRESIQAASKALLIGQEQQNARLVASAKRDLAITYGYAGDFERAEQYAREALDGAQDLPAVAAPSLKTLGDVAMRKGQASTAVEHYRRAEAIASDKYRPLVQISLANALLLDKQPAAARAVYRAMPAPPSALQLAYKRGIGNLSLAEGDHAQALRLFGDVAAQAAGSDAAYHRLWGQDGVGRTLLAMGRRDAARQAFADAAATSEAIRSRFRSEEFKSGLFGDVQQVFDRAIDLAFESGDVEGAWLLSEQSRSRALLDVVRDRVVAGAAAAADNAASLRGVGAAAARRQLREGEAIVAFHTLDDSVLAWVVRADGVQGARLPLGRAALALAVDAFRQSVFNRKPAVTALGAGLYTQLLAPLALRDGEQLLIVPHDSLHYLPFQALRDGAGSGARYLIERHPLAFAPSAGIALALGQRRVAADHAGASSAPRLVAFGNPGTDAQLALPDAEREVKLIGDLFPNNSIFTQAAASKQQFRQIAPSAGILHVAAHAEVDVVDPLQSRILLAPADGDSGFLAAREVYGLNLERVSLVTLSACESGLGRIARGDEIMGFTRSFLSAGAASLLVSLWPVADDSTELLMTTLYGRLAAGGTAAQAMQAAQITVMRRPRFAHPFFWAAFDLVGDWRMTLAPPAGARKAAL